MSFRKQFISLLLCLAPLACSDAQSPASGIELQSSNSAQETKVADCGKGGALCLDALTNGLDQFIDSEFKQKFIGVVLVTKDGVPIYSHSTGMADRQWMLPNGPDTNFRIGSVTKQFTAAAILQLQEAGLLKVTDTFDKHLPYYPKEVASKVTIHNLLTHTSGIPSFQVDPDFMQRIQRPHTVRELLELVWNEPLEFEPGSDFKYCNNGYVALGAIIEAVSRMSYGEYLEKNLFAPAGMKRTMFGDAPELHNRAIGYKVLDDEIVKADPIHMSVPHAAGGIRSTANDLALWDRALTNGTILKPESLKQLYTPEKNDYAYGWAVRDMWDKKVISHGGVINGFATGYSRLVDHGIVVVSWSNIPMGGHPSHIGVEAIRLLLGGTSPI